MPVSCSYLQAETIATMGSGFKAVSSAVAAAGSSSSISRKQCTPIPEVQVPQDLEWQPNGSYRLGDVVLLRDRKTTVGFSYHIVTWPNSLASMYIRATNQRRDFSVFLDCIRQKYALATRNL